MPPAQQAPAGGGDGQGQGDQALDERVGKLEAGQETLSGKLDHLISIVTGGNAGNGDEHGPQPSGDGTPAGVAHEIRAQLEERDRKEKAAKAEGDRDGRLTAVETRLSEMAEKPPEDPPTRRARIMGWT